MDISKYRVCVLVAGGVGITPMLSVALDLAAQAGAQGRAGASASGKTAAVHLVWVVRQPDVLSWLEEPEESNSAGSPSPLETLRRSELVRLHIYCTRASEDGPDGRWTKGRPNIGSLLQTCVDEASSLSPDKEQMKKAQNGSTAAKDVCVLACGPAPLVGDLQGKARKFGIDFHKETFEF